MASFYPSRLRASLLQTTLLPSRVWLTNIVCSHKASELVGWQGSWHNAYCLCIPFNLLLLLLLAPSGWSSNLGFTISAFSALTGRMLVRDIDVCLLLHLKSKASQEGPTIGPSGCSGWLGLWPGWLAAAAEAIDADAMKADRNDGVANKWDGERSMAYQEQRRIRKEERHRHEVLGIGVSKGKEGKQRIITKWATNRVVRKLENEWHSIGVVLRVWGLEPRWSTSQTRHSVHEADNAVGIAEQMDRWKTAV